MAANFTTYISDQVLNWMKGTTFAAAPAALYVDLLDSGSSSVLNTISGSANRQAVTLGTITDDGTGRIVSNSADVDFTASAAAGATVAYMAIYDAITGGNQLAVVASAKTILTGDPVSIVTGDLSIKMD